MSKTRIAVLALVAGFLLALFTMAPSPTGVDAEVSTQAINASTGADATIVMPNYCSSVTISSRGGIAFRLAFDSGDITAGNYLTVSGATSFEDEGRRLAGQTIYVRGATGSADTLEVQTWVE